MHSHTTNHALLVISPSLHTHPGPSSLPGPFPSLCIIEDKVAVPAPRGFRALVSPPPACPPLDEAPTISDIRAHAFLGPPHPTPQRQLLKLSGNVYTHAACTHTHTHTHTQRERASEREREREGGRERGREREDAWATRQSDPLTSIHYTYIYTHTYTYLCT